MSSDSIPSAPENGVTFAQLDLIEPIQRALREKKYVVPTPIQAQAIPVLLAGSDLIGCAQTGTGKTAAFALPILQRLSLSRQRARPRCPKALILSPTRELTAQIGESFATYGRHLDLRHTVVFGGVGQQPQVSRLKQGVEILVATPGRMLDLCQQGYLSLQDVEIFVLDEADRMLDMGFITDVKKTIRMLPRNRQSLLFSATMPEAIRELTTTLLHEPKRIEVTPVASTAERVEQRVCIVSHADKPTMLMHLLETYNEGLVLVFSRTKHGANRIAERLIKSGVRANAIHGNKTQGARERALKDFRTGRARVLVATDIASRGIDVKGVELVVNFDLPEETEAYVHRIGRTARAGADGLAYSFCEPNEYREWIRIERLIRQSVPVYTDHPLCQPAPAKHQHQDKPKAQAQQKRPARPQHPRKPQRHEHSARPQHSAPAAEGAPAPEGHGHSKPKFAPRPARRNKRPPTNRY